MLINVPASPSVLLQTYIRTGSPGGALRFPSAVVLLILHRSMNDDLNYGEADCPISPSVSDGEVVR